MLEAAVLVSITEEPLYWFLPDNRSSVAIPDASDLWIKIWEHRDNLLGVAHSHPGTGQPLPSLEDLTTFSSIEKGLGRRLQWWITSADQVISLFWGGKYSIGCQ